MATSIKITDTQREVLKLATYRPDGNIEPLPATLRGGARKKVIDGLLARALVVTEGDQYLLSDAGYAAAGRKRKPQAPVALAAKVRAPVAAAKAKKGQDRAEVTQPVPHIRENSKQATVVAMLRRPEGATIAQVMEATGWQAHTVRGTFAGALKKKLGLSLTSEKPEGGERVYRCVA